MIFQNSPLASTSTSLTEPWTSATVSAPDQPIRLLNQTKSRNSGPILIFIPGMDGTGRLFKRQAEGLEAIFDIRGISLPPNDLSTWQELVKQVAALIRTELKLSSPRPIYICGESFGSCLALKLAIEAPDLCQGLILVNSASAFRHQPWIHWVASVVSRMPTSLYHLATLGLMPFLISQDRVSAENRQALLAAMQCVSPESAAWRISLLSRFNLEALPLHKLTQPVLVITGAADQLLSSTTEADRLVKALPNARKVVLPLSGHACLLEADINLSEILATENFLTGWEKRE